MKTKNLLIGGLTSLMLPLIPGVASAAPDILPLERDFGMTPHEHYDQLLGEILMDITILGVVFSLVALYMMIVYKRKNKDDVGKQPKLSTQAQLGWLIIPSMLFLGEDLYMFAAAWDLHDHYRKVPENSYEVKLTGQLWSWSYEYPNGVQTMNELVVPQGKPVLLRMTSSDVVHSHYMQKYRVTEDLMPGRVTYQWFMPDEIGESVVTCREYCGLLHSGMYGTVKVVSQADFDTWMASQVSAMNGTTSSDDYVVNIEEGSNDSVKL